MYDHYIAVDWAQRNMAIARMTSKSKKITTIDVRSDIADLKVYLKSLRGSKLLTFEETTPAQWLYSELKDYVDEIIVCDPYRNKLLSEGPKNDKIDAEKLVRLLRADLLKAVFHSGDVFIQVRKLVSAHEDTVKACVRAVNQRSALFRATGKNHKKDTLDSDGDVFILKSLDTQIELFKKERKRYEAEFLRLSKTNKTLKNLKTIPTVQDISAVYIASRVVDITRFPTVKHFWSYCGLVKHLSISGGKVYGKRTPRHCRVLKTVICRNVNISISKQCDNFLYHAYLYYTEKKKYSEPQAKVATRRFFASTIYGVMKSDLAYAPKHREKVQQS